MLRLNGGSYDHADGVVVGGESGEIKGEMEGEESGRACVVSMLLSGLRDRVVSIRSWTPL